MRVGQARKRDANEPAIVQALERIGKKVRRLSEKGFADLCVFDPPFRIVLIEVKSKIGKLTAAQVKHAADGWPVFVVRDVADALAIFGITV